MPSAITNNARIRTNTPAENAYNALLESNRNIALRQLRLSTGKRINAAADDVSGYITARALQARNGSLKAALNAVGDAQNVSTIAQDGLANVNDLVTQIRDAAAQASSGALGTDEKVALAQSAYNLAKQIQTVVDSTVYGGKALLGGSYSTDFVIGYSSTSTLITLGIDLTTGSTETSVSGQFNLAVTSGTNSVFAGITNLNLFSLNSVTTSSLGIFSSTQISSTLTSLASALTNVNKVASYVGGIVGRLDSQEEVLGTQITNYNAAISRIEDADVALEQLELLRAQFLQQSSLTSLAQANSAPQGFLQLFR